MGHTFSLEAQALWKILVAGLILGAGLPALFAVGVRSLAYGQGGDAETQTAGSAPATPHPAFTFIGYACFVIVLAAVALGIIYIVATGFGKVMTFEHIYPSIHAKT
jgi:hypothetical protein